MERYDYFSHVCNDVREYIEDHGIKVNQDNRDEIESQLNDDLFCEDSVTGNASGSYYCNAWRAEEAIAHNWDLLSDAIEEFGGCSDILRQGAEGCDVTIRCYILPQAISKVLDEIEEDEPQEEREMPWDYGKHFE